MALVLPFFLCVCLAYLWCSFNWKSTFIQFIYLLPLDSNWGIYALVCSDCGMHVVPSKMQPSGSIVNTKLMAKQF